jgi:hypothetical protein
MSNSQTLVFDEVVPILREMGVMDDEVFNTIIMENPDAGWLGSSATRRPHTFAFNP